MTCHSIFANCTREGMSAHPMLLFHFALIVLLHFNNDQRVALCKARYTTKPTLAKYEPRLFTCSEERLFNTNQTPAKETEKGGTLQENENEKKKKTAQCPDTLPQFFQVNPTLHNATNFLGFGGLNARKKKKNDGKAKTRNWKLTHCTRLQSRNPIDAV